MSFPTIKKIESELEKLVIDDPAYKSFREKSTKLPVLGLRLPILQKFTKEFFDFSDQSEKEILNFWDEIWKKATWHETRYLPLFYYRNEKKNLNLTHWNVLKKWIDQIESWEHSDALSYLYSFLFEKYPNHILPTFKKWNTSSSSWKQRISIVSLIYYASKKRKAPNVDLVLKMVEPLIKSKDHYVQKAVGWTLRECFTLYPNETMRFLNLHIKDLSSHSFSYATERISKEEKNELKKLRKII